MTTAGNSIDMQGRFRDALPGAAVLLLVLLQMSLFTRGYRMSADDAGFIETFMGGPLAVLQSGATEAHANGRVGMYLLRPLNTAAAYLAGYYPVRLVFVALHYLCLLLFAMLASRVFKARIAPLLFLALVVMHPLAFQHMPPNAYPLQNTLPFLLILGSRLLLFRLEGSNAGGWHTPWVAVAYSMFILGMFFSEYAIIFGTALLLTEHMTRLMHLAWADGARSGIVAVTRQSSFRLDALAVVVVTGAYLLFRWFNPSHYDGNSPDGILNIGRTAITAARHIISGTVFGQIEPRIPSLDGIDIGMSLGVGALATYCAYHFTAQARCLRGAWGMLAIAACGAFFVVLPVAVTLKQQSWCLDSGDCGFVDSRVAYYWVGLGVLAILSLLLSKMEKHGHWKSALVAVSVIFGLVSTVTYASNAQRAEHMDVMSSSWERARILACMSDRIPRDDESLRRLIDPRSEVMFHPTVRQQTYWKRYVEWLSAQGNCTSDQRRLQSAYVETVQGMRPLAIGQRIKFSRVASHSYLDVGWSPEPWGVWSIGRRATLKAGLANDEQDVVLVLRALRHDVGPETRPVTIEVNGATVAVLEMTNEAAEYRIDIPASLRRENGGGVMLAFIVPDPTSPMEAGSGIDTRKLGVGLVEASFVASR